MRLPKEVVERASEIEPLFEQLGTQACAANGYYTDVFAMFQGAARLRALPPELHGFIVCRAAERLDLIAEELSELSFLELWRSPAFREVRALHEMLEAMVPAAVRGSPETFVFVCEWAAKKRPGLVVLDDLDLILLVEVERYAKDWPLLDSMSAWLRVLRERRTNESKPDFKLLQRIAKLLGDVRTLGLLHGEAWSDAAISEIEAAPPDLRAAWIGLIDAATLATSASPSAKWLKTALSLRDRIGEPAFVAALTRWFPLVDKPRTVERVRRSEYDPDYTNRIIDPHMDVLKGLCWLAASSRDPELARALGRLALSAYRKVPGLGPRATKVGNAAVYALGAVPGMDSLGQLAMLRVKVKFGTAQKMIEKALNAAAQREGLPREEIEELGVPSYGLTDVGVRREEMGEFAAELRITGIGSTELSFVKNAADGKPGKLQKSVPAAVKTEFADELKELKAAAKDIGAMLPAQRDRIDSLYLDNKAWPYATWRERYLDHPLVGVLSRRLIWLFSDSANAGVCRSGTTHDDSGTLVDVAGNPLDIVSQGATVRLWHPLEAPGGTDEVLAWRRFFEDRQLRQPFKQAHREVYLLTDAERATQTYSNRYAAHIIRQHQFNALCAIRGWKNKLRLMVDAEYPPAFKPLRAWNLRAEFWIEGVGDEYGTDTNESSVYNLLTTDQVRFYPIDAVASSAHAGGGGYGLDRGAELAAGLRLGEIPALVFSEIMRDVDLFVGVGSVANNPAWHDGGPEGHYRTYWWTQGFGDLSGTGASRRELLGRLVPRLKIASMCSLLDKFLVVKGKLRTYKIHLGSGNILMEPDDQYLCIVPNSRDETTGAAGGGDNKVFLPFEGDRTLSIILSKAFMLAADDQIKDESIVSQIKRK